MFNDLRVSNSVSGQVPSYFVQEYPNFVNFLKDYYRFLETNGNSLDLLHGIQDLIDIETYTGVDYTSVLREDIDADDEEVLVNGHVKYPLTNGLLKINNEIVFYRSFSYEVFNDIEYTRFTGCVRGYTYNTLTIEEGFKPNIKTTPESHTAGAIVENQSYTYLLYFLEQLREQYLSDFPKGILADNLEKGLNINNLLKKIKDFYLTKGTPRGIEFYFKFLFQQKSEIRNYRDSIFTPSDSVYEDKLVVRLENLDSFNVSDLILEELVQSGNTFTILSFESLYSNKTLAFEYEISTPEKLLPTKFAKIISTPNLQKKYLYVDSTEGFPSVGVLKYRDFFINYTSKQSNYFICDDTIQRISTFFNGDLDRSLGEYVYDVETLCVMKNFPEVYFSVYTGIANVSTTKNIGYVPGDIGFVSQVTLSNDPILSSWVYNDILPARTNNGLLSSVTNLYFSDTAVILSVSKVPFSQHPGEGSPQNNELEMGSNRLSLIDRFVKIPRIFNLRDFSNRENTIAQFPVGLMIDGTPLMNWKNNNVVSLGRIEKIDIQNGGSNFNIDSPPMIMVNEPTTNETGKETAELELKISGAVSEVNIENGGSGYPKNVSIFVKKSDINDPNVEFKQAIVSPVVVGGKITRVKIIDPGSGYTATPIIEITPDFTQPNSAGTPADISVLVEGSIYRVDYKTDGNNNPIRGKKYTQNPSYELKKGFGATAVPIISNGKLTDITLINEGKEYNSSPKVNVIDLSGTGIGAKVISKITNGKVSDFSIINSGINYNENTTRIEIVESGEGDLINLTTQTWTPINNYFQTINSDGSFIEEIDSENNIVTYNILGFPKNLKYHDKSTNTYQSIEFGEVSDNHSPIIGWAFDGSPIYGPFGFREALDSGSEIVKMTSGYRKKTSFDSIRQQEGGIGLAQFEIGYFAEDWEWIPDPLNLDQENGRFCVTPEFPDGVYAYFATIETLNTQTENKAGFPYFIGSKYKGSTFNEFNTKEIRNLFEENLTKFVSRNDTISIKPVDPGLFAVESIPESTDSKLSSIEVSNSGDLYKFGDIVVFDNTETKGFGASAFVSVLKGRNVVNVSKELYDYIEYKDESAPITEGTVLKTANGYEGTVYNVNQTRKEIYIDKTAGTTIDDGFEIFDDQNLTDTSIETKLTETINNNLFTTSLTNDVERRSLLITVNSVSNISVGDYIKIEDEYIKVIRINGTELFVIRGINGTTPKSYSANDSVKILNKLNVFSSVEFVINDVIKIESEVFRIVNILSTRESSIQGVDIVNGGSGISAGTYYLYFDGILQTNGGNNATTVTVLNGSVTELTFDEDTSISDNPLVQIGDSPTHASANFLTGITIKASKFRHVLDVERAIFSTTAQQHLSGLDVTGQTFIRATVTKFEQDRILTSIGAPNNLLVPDDEITVNASLQAVDSFEITNNGSQILVDGIAATGLNLFEGYSYIFTANGLRFEFFGISTDMNNNIVPGKRYFDITVEEVFDDTGELETFTIKPKASDLTEYFLVITDPDNPTITKNLRIGTISEPINGSYKIIRSTFSDFTFYTEVDPKDKFISNYNSQTIKYTTTSTTAKGPIEFVTLTSGGFSYVTPPGVSNIISDEGIGAILSPKTNSIGVINNITNNFSGYGFSSDFRQKPVVRFPQISQIDNIFTVSSVNLISGGEDYLFTPRVVITGGGLSDNDPSHAIIKATSAKTGIREILNLDLISKGQKYNSAPDISIEKYYFVELNGSGSTTTLTFKFPFNQYIRQDDKFKIRGYYLNDNNEEIFAESNTFLANLQTTTITCRESGSNVDLDPRITGTLAFVNQSILRYEFISESRVATANAIVTKSIFTPSEKIIFNVEEGIDKFGFVSRNFGWQPANSTLRIENFNYQFQVGDTVFGESSKSVGVITKVESSSSIGELGVTVRKPKTFLTKNSFLGSNFEKLQDSFRYQRFAYEIGVDTPLSKWKENYKQTVHPTGYNLFARTTIKNDVRIGAIKDDPTKNGITVIPNQVISTSVAQEISIRRKYNYLLTQNIGDVEVKVLNKNLTDVKQTEKAIVAVFEDFSDEFDGIKTSFPLRAINPLNPKIDNQPNYIENYDVDQMVVLLDNVIQTYGSSWFVTDSDKNIRFTSSESQGELLPEGEKIIYRKFNDSFIIHESSEVVSSAGSTFPLRDNSGNAWPAGTFSSIDNDNYLVFIDGICQNNSVFTISNTNNGQIDLGSEILPVDTQISVRYISGLLKNEFTSGSVTANTAVTLSNKPSLSTSKQSYFVFVDGALMTSGVDSIYDIDANKDIVFNVSFNYDSLVVVIDSLGVALTTQEDDIIAEKYSYKINDGQLEIPVGTVINPEEYILEIAGVVQTPYLVYEILSSGERKINFTEPPRRFLSEENDPNTDDDDIFVGRQFIGLLYQRSDPTGSGGTTKNYQFDDISQNIIHIKENLDNFMVGDNISRSDGLSFATIIDKKSISTKIIAESQFVNATFAPNDTGTITVNSLKNIFEGDRFEFNGGIGLTSLDNDELEITSINYNTNVITITNISSNTLSINIEVDDNFNVRHNTIEISNLETSIANKDNAFVDGSVILSGASNLQSTNVNSNIDNTVGLRLDSAIARVQAGNVSGGALTGNADIVNGGSLYAAPLPEIKLIGGSGSGATVNATIIGGVITQLTLSGGTGYDAADLPELIIEGPRASILEVPAGDGASFSVGDYIFINETEVVKVTGISTDDLTVSRGELGTNVQDFYIKTTNIRKVIPYQVTSKSFRRGFDGNKTEFKLTEEFRAANIPVDSDIFVILNGVLQKIGSNNSYTLSESGGEIFINFTEAPKFNSPCNIFYLGQTISVQNISDKFNGVRRVFELRDSLGEIFSFIAKNQANANISANLIIFIDGVYQIPSVISDDREPAYSDSLSSYRLFGSLIEFSAPPSSGSTFEAFIYVGSNTDYETIDIEPAVESGDFIDQTNERGEREVINIISSNTLAVTDSLGQIDNTSGNAPQFADLIQSEPVRESLRLRRLLSSQIATGLSFPTVGRVLLTSPVTTIEIESIDNFIPTTPDIGTDEFTFELAASTNFPVRFLNSRYTTATYGATPSDNDTLSNVIVGYDLPFNNIIHLATGAPTIFDESSIGSEIVENGKVISKPITKQILRVTYGPTTFEEFGANVVNWEPDDDNIGGKLYLKLDDTSNPPLTTHQIKITYQTDPVTSNTFTIDDDDLISEYQTLSVGDKFYYTT